MTTTKLIPALALLCGCPFVTEGTVPHDGDEQDIHTAAADARCGDPIPCGIPSSGDDAGSSSEAGNGTGEEDEGSNGGSDDLAGSTETGETFDPSSSESTGEPDPYGACGACEAESSEFYAASGECVCTPFCLSVEDCPGEGMCVAGAGCFLPCDVSTDCPEGMNCHPWQYSVSHGNACFWG
jgi:hypothetical protein